MGMFDSLLGAVGSIANIIPGVGPIIGSALGGVSNDISQQEATDDAWAKHKWNLEYNSPLNVRKRQQAAGLSPYADHGAWSTPAQGGIPNPPPPNIRDPMDELAKYTNAQQSNAASQVADKQIEVMDAEILSKMAGIAESGARTARSKFDLGLSSDLRNYTLDAAAEGVRKTRADITRVLQENEQSPERHASAMAESSQRQKEMGARIRQIDAQNDQTKVNTDMAELMLSWAKLGFTPSDPYYIRAAIQSGRNIDPKQVGEEMEKQLNRLPKKARSAAIEIIKLLLP